jgi:hypothetical protein
MEMALADETRDAAERYAASLWRQGGLTRRGSGTEIAIASVEAALNLDDDSLALLERETVLQGRSTTPSASVNEEQEESAVPASTAVGPAAAPTALFAAPSMLSRSDSTPGKRKRVGAANGTPAANGGHIETDHGLVDALWQLSKEQLPEELAYYLDVECEMLRKRYVSDQKGYGRFLRSLHSSNRLAASGTSCIGIERMFHTEEHLAKMDVFLEKVKQLDQRFADLPILVFERALLWGALRYRAWPDALTKAVVNVASCSPST